MLLCSWCASADLVSVVAGVPQCRPCRAHAVDSQDRAEEIFESVVSWLESLFGAGRLRDVRLEYGTIRPKSGTSQLLGHTQLTYSAGMTDLLVKTAPSLPEHALGAVLAHECGHVLLFVDDKTLVPHSSWPTDDHVVEGFCEVVASQWLESRKDSRSKKLRTRMDNNRTPVYGDGFRAMYPVFLREGSLVKLRRSLVDDAVVVDPVPAVGPEPPVDRSTPRDRIPVAPVPTVRHQKDPAPDLARHRPVIVIDRVDPGHVATTPSSGRDRTTRPVIPMKKPRG